MSDTDWLLMVYLTFGFAFQALLALNFAARNWLPELERRYGWIIYALGLVALAIGALMLIDGRAWYLVVAPLLLALWAGYGFRVDLWKPIAWRRPPHWPVFGPYVGLFVASLLLYWGSMWAIGVGYWIAFGLLYALHTALNIYSHRGSPASAAASES